MNLIKCPQGHFYDEMKHKNCPMCQANGQDHISDRGDLGDQKTVASHISRDIDFGNQLTERYLESVRDDEKTISLLSLLQKGRPIAGWLVCTSGSQAGKSMSVYSGRNFAGRGHSMDIRLTDDEMITRENHFSVVYDPKSIRFSLVAGNGETQLNGKTICGAVDLKEDDEITVGETKYLFVPYCKGERNWNEKD